jgi:integrase
MVGIRALACAISAGLSEEVEDDDGKIRVKAAVGFHTCRHSCASLLFDAGRNIKQVSTWLGHADPAFTLPTYVHPLDEGIGGPLDIEVAEGVAV